MAYGRGGGGALANCSTTTKGEVMERLNVFSDWYGVRYLGYAHTVAQLQQWNFGPGKAWAENMKGEVVWVSE